MRKLMIFAITLFITGISLVYADNDRPIDVNQLPQKAQQFIKQHFPNEKIAYAKVERDFSGTKYEVVFAGSSKVEFRRNGEWKEVDCKYTAVPTAIVPQQITNFVTTRYPSATIVQIDRDKRDYEIKLNNGLELTFDLKFNLIEIDD